MISDLKKMFQESSMGKGQSIQQMVLGQVDIHVEKNELDLYLTLYPKYIKGLNVRAKTIKLLENNMGANLHNFCLGNDFQL